MNQNLFIVRPMTVRIGAEISGVDFRHSISEDLAQALRDAFAQYQVLFFRNQKLEPEELLEFGRVFGTLEPQPQAFKTAFTEDRLAPDAVTAIANHPEIIAVHADAQSTWVAGEQWHTDASWNPKPPSATILNLGIVPEVGGDTLFSSMYEAHNELSSAMKTFLAPLTAVHDGQQGVARAIRLKPGSPSNLGSTMPTTIHPVVRTHPVTGKKCLFFNENVVTRIVELREAESRYIHSLLSDHVKNPNFQCRFTWQKDSMVIWDNCAVQHLAVWDYFPNVRSGLRLNIVGDTPQ